MTWGYYTFLKILHNPTWETVRLILFILVWWKLCPLSAVFNFMIDIKYANLMVRSHDYTDILRVISPSSEIFYLPLLLQKSRICIYKSLQKSSSCFLCNEHQYCVLYLNRLNVLKLIKRSVSYRQNVDFLTEHSSLTNEHESKLFKLYCTSLISLPLKSDN
jgi:hypothetical protein